MSEMAQPNTLSWNLDGYGMSHIHGTVSISATFLHSLGKPIRTELFLYYLEVAASNISKPWRRQPICNSKSFNITKMEHLASWTTHVYCHNNVRSNQWKLNIGGKQRRKVRLLI
jgi:hypothetical protein